jgi:hypothetical protein
VTAYIKPFSASIMSQLWIQGSVNTTGETNLDLLSTQAGAVGPGGQLVKLKACKVFVQLIDKVDMQVD